VLMTEGKPDTKQSVSSQSACITATYKNTREPVQLACDTRQDEVR
jgi:hypothetical protein